MPECSCLPHPRPLFLLFNALRPQVVETVNVIRQLSADMGVPNVYRIVFMISSDAAPELLLGKKMLAKDAGKIFIVGGDALDTMLHECELLSCRGAELVPTAGVRSLGTHLTSCLSGCLLTGPGSMI